MTDGKDAASLRELGNRYREGDGVDMDPAKAAELLSEASDLGDAQAASSLGYMLMVGEGVPADRPAAEAQLRRAADAGIATAMCNLGVLLSDTAPDESVSWFVRAAEAGSLRAVKNLAAAYSSGSGVPLDKGRAAEYYRRASDLGDADSMCVLASMLRNGDGVPVDKPGAKPGAAELYRRAADQGDSEAQYDLAFMLDAGEGITQDRAEAERLFRLSADQGDTDACLCLGGILYERGDYEGAEGYFTDAALKGEVKAMYNLGLMYSEGSLGEPDTGSGGVVRVRRPGGLRIRPDQPRRDPLRKGRRGRGRPVVQEGRRPGRAHGDVQPRSVRDLRHDGDGRQGGHGPPRQGRLRRRPGGRGAPLEDHQRMSSSREST